MSKHRNAKLRYGGEWVDYQLIQLLYIDTKYTYS